MALQTNSHYRIDTITGGLFKPQRCVGHDSIVCHTGPIYDVELLKCEHGIILGQKELFRACKMKIVSSDNKSVVTQVDINQYVLSTWGEMVTVRCPGKAEQATKLLPGVYNIACLPHCHIDGKFWAIHGTSEIHASRHIRLPPVTLNHDLEVFKEIALHNVPKLYPQLETDNDYVVKNVDPASLQMVPVDYTALKVASLAGHVDCHSFYTRIYNNSE